MAIRLLVGVSASVATVILLAQPATALVDVLPEVCVQIPKDGDPRPYCVRAD